MKQVCIRYLSASHPRCPAYGLERGRITSMQSPCRNSQNEKFAVTCAGTLLGAIAIYSDR
jgi:hypothetical protein